METPGGMPGGARGQFLALQQDYIRPAQRGEVVQNTATDHAAADYNNLGMCLHVCSFFLYQDKQNIATAERKNSEADLFFWSIGVAILAVIITIQGFSESSGQETHVCRYH